jgi:folate-binding protein YgfZ
MLTTAHDLDAAGHARARQDAASLSLADRALLVASGPLRQKFLHGLLSNDLQARAPGQGVRAALMDAKGHLLTFLRALVTENEVVLELPADRRAEIERLLNHYRVAAPVRFAASTDVVLGILGPRALERLRAIDPTLRDLPPEDHALVTIAEAKVRVARAGDLPRDGYVLHVPAASADAVRAALDTAGAPALAASTVDALRVEDGRPWYGPDIGPKNLLHETGLVAEYHSPSKGCYVGQEVIARLEARGANVNQRLLGLRLREPRPAGTRLTAGDKDAGVLTTSGLSPRHGAIAMGYVHRSQAEPGSIVDAGGTPAEVAALPFPRE